MATAKKAPRQTLKLLNAQKQELLDLLKKLQKHRYHEPDSDAKEYCFGCHRSPYNVPAHSEGCLVVEVYTVLNKHKENVLWPTGMNRRKRCAWL